MMLAMLYGVIALPVVLAAVAECVFLRVLFMA